MIYFDFLPAFMLLILPVMIYFILPAATKTYGDALRVPFVEDIIKIKETKKLSLLNSGKKSFSFIRFLLLSLMWIVAVTALARPLWVGEPLPVRNESRNIMLVVDISNSMTERDFMLNKQRFDRLTAVKNVVSEFINKRRQDNLGLILFGTRAYLQVPLTYDHKSLEDVLWETDAGMAGTSTAIGDALAIALKNMPLEGKNKDNRIIILLTDGENNDGSLSMAQAISLAKEEGVKIYTVGVGSDEEVFFGGLFSVPKNSGLDEESLRQLAEETRGAYFRAKDVRSLMSVYAAIDKAEPQENEGKFVQEKKELYFYPAGVALLLFIVLMFISRKAL